MDIRKLQRAIVDGLEDVKGQDILVFNTEHLSPLFERVVIASGQSNRQTKALASSVREAVKAAGLPVLRTEGEENGEWIIVDCGAAVVHVMQPSIRDYYRLEEIWGGKPVKVKLAGATVGLVKASEGADDEDEAIEPTPKAKRKPAAKAGAKAEQPARPAKAAKLPPGVKTTGKKPSTSTAKPAAKAPEKKAPAKTAPAKTAKTATARPAAKSPSGKSPAARSPARKTAAGGKPAARTSGAREAGVKKIVVKPATSRTAATRAAAKKAPARPAAKAAKPAAAKKAPARRA
ncbi:MAG: ribosome silencing factor [Burkholderiaceae bacterium]